MGVIFRESGRDKRYIVVSCFSQAAKKAVHRPVRFLEKGSRGRLCVLPLTQTGDEYTISDFAIQSMDVPAGRWNIELLQWSPAIAQMPSV
mmetsp:Transcript_2120/g.4477  ORF Transcript_2120/g.4477 Transcript_2120/m.4477 type:complete len:90 (-) Transcript_2120:43-312(-)